MVDASKSEDMDGLCTEGRGLAGCCFLQLWGGLGYLCWCWNIEASSGCVAMWTGGWRAGSWVLCAAAVFVCCRDPV